MTEEVPNKQEFMVLWVDDQPGAVKTNKDQVRKSFEENYPDISLVILDSEDNTDAKEKLKKNNIEIVVTDFNLQDGEGNSGIDLINSIRRTYPAIDILFYHAGQIKKEDEEKARENEFVMIVEGKRKIAENLDTLIEKHLKRFNDIVFLRGMVLSNVIELELKMNDFLGKYMEIPETRKEIFHDFIMENSANQSSGKRKAIGNIVIENFEKRKPKIRDEFAGFVKIKEFDDFIKCLYYIEKRRNKLAHCKLAKGKNNVVVSEGDEEEFTKKDINSLLEKIRTASSYLDLLLEKMPKSVAPSKKRH